MVNFDAATRSPAFDNAPVNAAGFLGIPAELVDRQLPLAPRLGEGLSGLEGHLAGAFLDACRHHIGTFVQNFGAGPGRRRTPGLECSLGRRDCIFRVACRSASKDGERFFGCRINDRDLVGASALAPLAVDKMRQVLVHPVARTFCPDAGLAGLWKLQFLLLCVLFRNEGGLSSSPRVESHASSSCRARMANSWGMC